MRVRLAACLVAIGVALALPLGAQTRPNFTGTWALVIEKSTPATPERHQRQITIAQDGQTFTLTQLAFRGTQGSVSSSGVASAPPAREEFPYTLTYECDGAEHPTPKIVLPEPTTPPPAVPPGAVVTRMSAQTESVYRAIWTRDQLVIMTREITAMVMTTTASPGSRSQGAPSGATSRKAFSLDADGLLVVDSIRLSDPTPGGPTQVPPVPLHSVYRKAS